jgi:hypothetical protein
MKYHYVYKIVFNTGQFYIGSRTTYNRPEHDVSYWGSPVTHKHLWEDKTLHKEKYIIKVCKDIEEKRELEIKLIEESRKKFPNLSLNKGNSKGCPTEKCSEVGKLSYQNKTGIFSLTEDEKNEVRKKAGRNSVKTHKELGIGFFGISKDQRIETGRKSGNKLKELGIGLFGLSEEEKKEIVKKGAEASAKKLSKEFSFRSPEGKIVTGKNLRKFCRENNLTQSCMVAVKNSRANSHKGWTKA